MTLSAADPFYLGLLLATGFVAGWINTLAGGGSNLTLPALMVMGMPADVANATNRVAVFLQGVVGSVGFRRHGGLPTHDLWPILWPTFIGSALGAGLASIAPRTVLKLLLLFAMLAMTLVMVFRPSAVIAPPGSKSYLVRERPQARWWLLLAGVYGGFVQAGVGFILISALGGALRYDLVKTNALKLVVVTSFTVISLGIFIAQDLVMWLPGLVLSAGTMVGASAGVRFAVGARPETLRWLLLAMTVLGVAAALLSG